MDITKLSEARDKMRNIEDHISREFRIIDLVEILTNKLSRLEKIENNNILYQSILKDVEFNYEEIEEFNYNFFISPSDTIAVFSVKWFDSIPLEKILTQEEKLLKWLSFKLQDQMFELKREE